MNDETKAIDVLRDMAGAEWVSCGEYCDPCGDGPYKRGDHAISLEIILDALKLKAVTEHERCRVTETHPKYELLHRIIGERNHTADQRWLTTDEAFDALYGGRR